jgi:hypothetical protein
MPTAHQFSPALYQAMVQMPDANMRGPLIFRHLGEQWLKRFDGEPNFNPDAAGLPAEFPRVVLKSADDAWVCQITSVRADVFWRQQGEPLAAGAFIDAALPLLIDISRLAEKPIRRMAMIANRFAPQPKSPVHLAEHFCRDRWLAHPFNRPEAFEVHSHKTFKMAGRFAVNSWMRVRSATRAESGESVVSAEQDLNTVIGDPQPVFSDVDAREFFTAAVTELDVILALYFPET